MGNSAEKSGNGSRSLAGALTGGRSHSTAAAIAATLGLALAVVLVGVAAGVLSATEEEPPGKPCDLGVPEPTPLGEGIDLAQVPQAAEVNEAKTRNMWHRRDPIKMQTRIDLSEPLPPGVGELNITAGAFERADGLALETEQVQAQALVDQNGRRDAVRVTVCIDPVIADPADSGEAIRAAPGSYTGTVVLDDPRVSASSARYTVNLQYDDQWRVIAVVTVSGLLGGWAGLTLASGVSLAYLRQNKHKARAVLASFLGIAAVYTVYSAQYLSDPSWQGDRILFHALIASCVGAAYAATNVAGSAGSAREPAQDPQRPAGALRDSSGGASELGAESHRPS